MATANTTRSPRVRALAAALRAVREEHGISNRELAGRLSIDQSHLSRIETGKKTPSIETTAMILAALRTPPEERERILDLARNAREPNWLTVGIPGVRHQLAGAWECERAASNITEWHQNLIPGLLQTPDYARCIASSPLNVGNAEEDQASIESRLEVKASRREILTCRNPVQFRGIISESALRDPIGSPSVMAAQLRHLIMMSQFPNVSIQIVSRGIGYHPGMSGPFVRYEFDDAPPVVHFEHHISAAFDQDYDDTESYCRIIDALDRVALSSSESVKCVADVLVDKWSD